MNPSPRDNAARNAFDAFLSVETAGGVVLFAATALALGWENSPWHATYEHLWEIQLVHVGVLVDIDVSLHFFVNEVLMTLFFFVVGLEIRREAHDGALASLKLAALPVAAAVGGVARACADLPRHQRRHGTRGRLGRADRDRHRVRRRRARAARQARASRRCARCCSRSRSPTTWPRS